MTKQDLLCRYGNSMQPMATEVGRLLFKTTKNAQDCEVWRTMLKGIYEPYFWFLDENSFHISLLSRLLPY